MTTDRQIHRELQGISSDHFPIWNETLDYERGLPQFRQPPEFSEEGILIPTQGEYAYQQGRRRRRGAPPMQASSQLSPSPIGQVELDDNYPPMSLPPSQTEYEDGDPSYLAPGPWQQTAAQPPAAEPMTSLLEEHNTFLEGPHYDQNPEHLTMEESMNTMPGSTSAPMQLDPSGPASPYGQAQEDLSVFVPHSTPPYDTDIWQ